MLLLSRFLIFSCVWKQLRKRKQNAYPNMMTYLDTRSAGGEIYSASPIFGLLPKSAHNEATQVNATWSNSLSINLTHLTIFYVRSCHLKELSKVRWFNLKIQSCVFEAAPMDVCGYTICKPSPHDEAIRSYIFNLKIFLLLTFGGSFCDHTTKGRWRKRISLRINKGWSDKFQCPFYLFLGEAWSRPW